MKKIFKFLLITILLGSSIVIQNKASAQQVNVSLSVFQNSLSPYGRWVNHGTYGQVWISNTREFVPYQTNGHWEYTDYGWTWVSDYDWGWAPFHYGRWAYENGFGWYWVPGYDWAPAWVAWRNNGDYYGWAPLSPGLNISVGASYGNQIPYDRWVFVPHQYISNPYVNRYYVPRTRNVTIIKNTTVINNVNVRNNVHYVSGPRREDVERVNHTKIKTYTVSNSPKPGRTVINKNTINVYRPVVNKDNVTINNNNKTVVNKNNNNTNIKNNNNTTINNNRNNQTIKAQKNITVNKDRNLSNNKEPAIQNNANNQNINQAHQNNTAINKNNVPAVKKEAQVNVNRNNEAIKRAQQNNITANKNVQNRVQQKQFNNQPKQIKAGNNNRAQMRKPSPQPPPKSR